jgi:hypothetical protein
VHEIDVGGRVFNRFLVETGQTAEFVFVIGTEEVVRVRLETFSTLATRRRKDDKLRSETLQTNDRRNRSDFISTATRGDRGSML